MAQEAEEKGKKRRHRKKCQRRKRASLNELQLKGLLSFNVDEKSWNVVKVTDVLHRVKGPKLYDAKGSQWLLVGHSTHSLLEELLSSQLSPLSSDASCLKLKCAYLIAHPLERRQLRAFVGKIFLLFFRGELLDKLNMEQLCENIAATFTDLRTRGFLMSRDQISHGICFDRILWLNGLHFQLKKSIVFNILKALLNLFTHIFTSFFYSSLNYAGRIVHYRRDVWRRICLESFDLLRSERKLQLLTSADRQSVPNDQIHKLIFIPKKQTVRPIVTLRNAKVKSVLDEVRAVLRFVMRRQPILYGWGISNIRLFASAYRRLTLVHSRGQQKGQKMYFCTADVQNCYTSLEHHVLDGILREIVPPKSTFVVVSAQVTNKLYKYRKMKTEAGLSFADACSRLCCKDSEEFTSSPSQRQISGTELLQMIGQFAMRTVIREPICATTSSTHGRQLRQRLFVSGRGIAQGSSLSVALCNLYLGSVERKIYPERPVEVFCRRYMDDYIMIADRKQHIEQMITALTDGMPKFGLCFGKIKALKAKDKLPWCGLALNPRSLSLTVDYVRYRQRRSTLSLPSVLLQPAPAFGRPNDARLYEGISLGLNPQDVFVRDFLRQISKYVWNGFRKRSLPSQI
uniref:Telomerase reverse transcriptase n=1 Tax=Globodera rostochiensis TaxID=31243 RepID=A0A914IAM2_GLORO